MGIITAQSHALGRSRRFYASVETVPGEIKKPAATDAVKVLTSKFSFKQDRADRMDSRLTRSLLERITGKKTVTATLEAYLIGSGTRGTPPDLGEVFKAALGEQTISPATNVVYSLADTQDGLQTLSLHHEFDGLEMESIRGFLVETLKISVSGADPAKVSAEGTAIEHSQTGTTTVNGATVSSTTLVVADAAAVDVGSILQIGANTNGGVGFLVTTQNGATLTLDTALSAGNGDAVAPYVPTPTTAGSPIAGILGTIDIDGTTVPIKSVEITIKNGSKPITDEAFSATVTDYLLGYREVSGTIGVRARADLVQYLRNRKDFGTIPVYVTFGSVAGNKLTAQIPLAEFEFSDLEVPEAEEGTFNLPFRALASSESAADEITLIWE